MGALACVSVLSLLLQRRAPPLQGRGIFVIQTRAVNLCMSL